MAVGNSKPKFLWRLGKQFQSVLPSEPNLSDCPTHHLMSFGDGGKRDGRIGVSLS